MITTLKHTLIALLMGLQAASAWAQQTCHTAIPLTRPDSRYEDVANAHPAGSEVRDKVTGLVWQRCLQGTAWSGSTCTGTPSSHNWEQALDLARNALPSVAASGAAAVWRLPNKAELFSLAERACFNLAINTTWFPPMHLNDSWAWSSSPVAGRTGQAWGVGFSDGLANESPKSNEAGGVRLVRSGR